MSRDKLTEFIIKYYVDNQNYNRAIFLKLSAYYNKMRHCQLQMVVMGTENPD